MRKLCALLILTVTLLCVMTGCSEVETEKAINGAAVDFQYVKSDHIAEVFYEKRTGVMYCNYYRGVTVMLDKDGTPLTIERYKELVEAENNGQ